jgi:hypothetical protein
MSQGELSILDHTGDTKLIWDSNNGDEVSNARETFDKLRKKGFIAYAVKKDGEKGEVLTKFDPTVEKIIMCAAMAGG